MQLKKFYIHPHTHTKTHVKYFIL